MRALDDFEDRARDLCDRLALGLQASALIRSAPSAAAEAFCRSRLETRGQRNYGALDPRTDARAIVKRAAAR
jgi:putative acyl-CoA dehydrogenase